MSGIHILFGRPGRLTRFKSLVEFLNALGDPKFMDGLQGCGDPDCLGCNPAATERGATSAGEQAATATGSTDESLLKEAHHQLAQREQDVDAARRSVDKDIADYIGRQLRKEQERQLDVEHGHAPKPQLGETFHAQRIEHLRYLRAMFVAKATANEPTAA